MRAGKAVGGDITAGLEANIDVSVKAKEKHRSIQYPQKQYRINLLKPALS